MRAASAELTPLHKWSVVCLLALGMVIAYVDRTNLSVVLALREFRDLFKLSDFDRGLLNSAFFWSYAILQIPAGWIVDRYGTKMPYGVGFFFWGIVSAATGLVQSVNQLVAARLLLGVGESISTAASLRWIRFNCAEQQRGLATGVLFSGTKLGAAAGIPITTFLLARFNWRMMFVILGLGGLVWLFGWVALVRQEDRPKMRPSRPDDPQASSTFGMLSTPALWGILLGTFSYNYFIYFCLTWLPAYFVEARHLSLNSMSFYTMFSFAGMAVIGILAGALADRLIRNGQNAVRVRRIFTLLGFIAGSTEVFGALSRSQSVSIFFALFSLSGLGLATANYWALTQTLVPKHAIGRVVGLQNFSSNCSGILAPVITGWLKQITGSYEASMIAVLVVLLVGIYSYGFLVKEHVFQPQPSAV